MNQKVIFTHERSTKNTERYNENGPKNLQVIGALYVQRSAFNGTVPQTITVTIEA